MNKKIKSFILYVIVITMVIGLLTGCTTSKKEEDVDARSKVHFEGIGVAIGQSEQEVVDAINANENGNPRIIIELDNEYEGGKLEVPEDISLAEAQEIIMKHRQNAKEYYVRTNNEILQDLELAEFDISFVADSYAPYIVAEYDRDITLQDIEKTYKLAEQKIISSIYIQSPMKMEQSLDSAMDVIEGTEIINDAIYDGTGIVIGILDVGIVDKNNTIFDNVDLHIRDEWWYEETIKNHATQVAACALAVAPEATILSVQVDGHPSGEIEWMLDNGVNVINMSYYYTDESMWGTYISDAAYCDYIAREYWVTFTVCAGNEGKETALVTAPNGYNVLTVGGCEDSGVRRLTSSYKEKFKINFPNFLAPGSTLMIPTFSEPLSGTSYAAPITAGTVALLMQKEPYLTLFPERVMAILMATTQRIEEYAMNNGFNDEAGTGVLNLTNAMNSIDNCISFDVSEDNVGGFVSTKSIYLVAGQRIRIAFVSLVNNDESDTSELVTDYDLHLYNSSGTRVEYSVTSYNNEFIDYVVKTSGYYTIKIKQFSAKKTTDIDNCAYAYFVE